MSLIDYDMEADIALFEQDMLGQVDEESAVTPAQWGYLKERVRTKGLRMGVKLPFYVGADSIARKFIMISEGRGGTEVHPLREDYDAALADAKKKCLESNQPQVVVKIIAVIKPMERPVEVDVIDLQEARVTNARRKPRRTGKERRAGKKKRARA